RWRPDRRPPRPGHAGWRPTGPPPTRSTRRRRGHGDGPPSRRPAPARVRRRPARSRRPAAAAGRTTRSSLLFHGFEIGFPGVDQYGKLRLAVVAPELAAVELDGVEPLRIFLEGRLLARGMHVRE